MDTFLPESYGNRRPPDTAPTSVPDGGGAVLGELLRRARERRGLTLLQVSGETRIPWRHLEALEHGNWTALPGGLYRRTETRAYADAVGLDHDVALAALDRALGPLVTPVAAIVDAQRQQTQRARRLALIAVAVGAATMLVVLTAWTWWSRVDERSGIAVLQSSEIRPVLIGAVSTLKTTPVVFADAVRSEGSGPPQELEGGGPSAGSMDEYGELVVDTDPDGARVTVDGIGWGITPLAIRNLSFGDKRIRVTKDGYAPEERVVRMAEDHTTVAFEMSLASVP
jgi:hypothetical protein